MKRLLLTVALLPLIPAAVGAAEMVDITPPSTEVLIGVDQVKIYRFDEPFTRVEIPKDGIVEVTPRSQMELNIIGRNPGRTPFVVIGEGGRRIFTGTLVVEQEAGHRVRIYRLPTQEEKTAAKDRGDGKTDAADDYWCSDVRCSSRIPVSR